MDQEELKNPKKQQLTDPQQSKFRDYSKFSAMFFQMGITIAFGVWSGMKLDEYFPITKFPLFTVSLSLLSIFASMYFVIRDVLKK